MSTIPATEIERNRHEPGGRIPDVLATTTAAPPREAEHESQALRTMSLWAARPGRPLRPQGELHARARCDGHREASTNRYPRKAHRRQRCATVLNTSGTAQPSVARSVTENLVSSAATPAKPPSVQRSALTASCVGGRMTVDGYVGFRQPDHGQGGRPAGILRRFAMPSEEVVQ